ncbi:MAG: DUF4388 domain-containing protein [Candidatus Dormibacteraceae bacterium]
MSEAATTLGDSLLQAKGSLTETSLRSLLESAQSERATGTLTVRGDNASPSTLYFLFGHLFHATGESGAAGDDAVVRALGSSTGDFDFDARAKLPADETVRASIPELLDRASQVQQSASEPPRQPALSAPAPQHASTPPPGPAAQRSWSPTTYQVPGYQAPGTTSEPPPPAPLPEAQAPASDLKQRLTPRHGREPIPVPHGQVIYDSLKSSFVDFPRLITTLERERFTGYVRLLTDQASGLIFFREGRALECVFDHGTEPTVELSTRGLRSFNGAVSSGEGVLDVVSLSTELVDGLYQLTTSDPIYTELYAAWVNSRSLLEFLASRKLTGTVMVQSSEAIGVILLAGGDLAGAYTSRSRDIADNADQVLALCDDEQAMIEVKATDDVRHRPLQVEEVIGPRRGPAAVAVRPGPATPPGAGTMPGGSPAQGPAEAPRSFAAPPPAALPGQHPGTSTLPVPTPVQPGQQPDWDAVLNDLQQYSDEALGTRSRKVKEALAASDRSQEGIEQTIDQIPQISILFVDAPRLEQLAEELRQRLRNHLGQ